MKIATLGEYRPARVDGVAFSETALCRAMVDAGAEVHMYAIGGQLGDEQLEGGVTLRTFPKTGIFGTSALERFLAENPEGIELVRMNSVFKPQDASLSRKLQAVGLRLVLKPCGGYAPEVFRRHRIKKWLYWTLAEKHHLRRAAGVQCLTEKEEARVRALGYRGATAVIPNTVPIKNLGEPKERGARLVVLCRFDILNKGLDGLVDMQREIERRDPCIEMHIHGSGPDEAKLRGLVERSGCSRLRVMAPVFGPEKTSVLETASVLVQYSRWEAFGNSIAEAAERGTPVALTRHCDLAETVTRREAGIILAMSPREDAEAVIELCRDRNRGARLGSNGRAWVAEELDPLVIARKHLRFYERVLKGQ